MIQKTLSANGISSPCITASNLKEAVNLARYELELHGSGSIIGAWLICQILNQDALGKAATESMFQKARIATALNCVLSNFGPIDDWTHYGAAFTGISYGFLTCPILQFGGKKDHPNISRVLMNCFCLELLP